MIVAQQNVNPLYICSYVEAASTWDTCVEVFSYYWRNWQFLRQQHTKQKYENGVGEFGHSAADIGNNKKLTQCCYLAMLTAP